MVMISYPEGTNFDKLWDEVAAEVESHEGLEATDAGAADEDGGRDIPGLVVFGGWGRGERGDLVVVQFDDGWVDPNRGEELLHDVAHAAGSSAEDDDRVLRYEAADSGLGRLGHVDGEGGGVWGRGWWGWGWGWRQAEVDDVVRATSQALHRRKSQRELLMSTERNEGN